MLKCFPDTVQTVILYFSLDLRRQVQLKLGLWTTKTFRQRLQVAFQGAGQGAATLGAGLPSTSSPCRPAQRDLISCASLRAERLCSQRELLWLKPARRPSSLCEATHPRVTFCWELPRAQPPALAVFNGEPSVGITT